MPLGVPDLHHTDSDFHDIYDLHGIEYADEDEHRRDHHPRRLRGTAGPEQRRWWIPGLRSITAYFREACSGWQASAAGMVAIASIVSCMDAGGGGGSSLRHLRTWGPGGPVPFHRWVREVMIWSVANSDMNEFRLAAFVASRLTGTAREYVDE